MPSTVRIYNPSGLGYRDVTSNDEAEVIRDVTYDEEGKIVEHKVHDPETGSTTVTEYEDGKKQWTEERDAAGMARERHEFDEDGRVVAWEVTENFETARSLYRYDRLGRISAVEFLGAGGIEAVLEFRYGASGFLSAAHFTPTDGSAGSGVDLSEDGEITDSHGDQAEVLTLIRRHLAKEYGSPNRHQSTDMARNRVTVTHNPDGSFDVKVEDSNGRLVLLEYYATGRCYIGDECPFRR